MRIVQIIDSLDAGGAERMAVNYANALANKIEFSGLVTTRKEGALKQHLGVGVKYLFLQKKRQIDIAAIFRLRKYIAKNKIEIIHAHSSSFFIAVLVKLTLPKIRIIWHDHYGNRTNQSYKENRVLIFLSVFFSSILVVNLQLEEWSKKYMKCSQIFFIPNFASINNISNPITALNGVEGKRIVFLANLKRPKNHILILKAFLSLNLNELGWSLHLIGKDYYDNYSNVLKDFIESNSLKDHIFLYGEKNDISHILSQANIGVLASTDEGFPVTLLEYALHSLPVVSTNVGYCSSVIKNEVTGLLFNPSSVNEAAEKLNKMIENVRFRQQMSESLERFVIENYSEDVVINKLVSIYQFSY
ncbi:glycosyltransferase [Flavobacterium mesophilum]|uniref:glycosyltransferase n=1 Tax=Flavobacterium mesophilum TaxID=3143495 RepID=UPI0031D12A69